ncbi:gamma-glutamyltransferase family protein [Thalassococcus sp. CAU 1522]|uniref:Gamma-glutamyltransferase family protein n=1 Tax=Thalassococcus arenae TaxID=2851652 RepID=A0ABS6N2W9_9RHOB|nr:gamma-glutamyltransferase [Thalassococcus arenae]MBV2358375.1 gamma-glutamyltransferase family protein [Thalassococcus arenae]
MTLGALLSDGAAAAADARTRWLDEGGAIDVTDHLMAGRAAQGAGRFGAIASGSPHATRIGMDILRAGGTAADAAAAAALAMMVADPPNASPAGRGHILWTRPGEDARAIDGATSAPDHLPAHLKKLPDRQALPLPGIVRAILKLHSDGGRLPLRAIATPARNLAGDGFVVPQELARIWAWRAPDIADDDARRIFLPGQAPVPAGARFRNPALADFFDRLILTGRDPFSDPGFTEPLCRRLASKGAFWSTDALATAEPKVGETVSLRGPDWTLTSIGRQGWGHTVLRIVSLVASADTTDACDAEVAHLLAILCAFEERPEELRSLKPKTDPLAWDVLRDRLGEPIPDNWAAPQFLSDALVRARHPQTAEERDTTHLSVVDSEGMRVALTQSIGPHFGSRVADRETGLLLAHSYRMAESPTPGARDVTEQCPCLLEMSDAAYALGGAGSERIPGAVAAVIRHLLSGRPLSAALAAPRSNWVGATARIHIDAPASLEVRLAAAGAEVAFTGRGPVDHLGIVQAAGRHRDGRVCAAADPAYCGTAAAE